MSAYQYKKTTLAIEPQKNINPTNSTKLIPVPQWNQYHQWPSRSSLRYWIFHAKTNGFHKVIRRIARRVLIDETDFFAWVNAQQEGSNQ